MLVYFKLSHHSDSLQNITRAFFRLNNLSQSLTVYYAKSTVRQTEATLI
jgi:hypothetical protein